MHLLVVNQYYAPDVAASGQRLTDLAEDLGRRHRVTVLAGSPSYDPDPGEARGRGGNGVAVLRIASTAFRRHRLVPRLANYVSYALGSAVAGARVRRVDAVIAGTDPPLVGLVGWWLSRLHRVPLIHLAWDLHPQAAAALGMLRGPGVVRMAARVNAFVLRRAARVIVPGESMREPVIEAGASPRLVQVISHWEDADLVRPVPKDNPWSRRHGLAHRYVVMYSGNLGLGQGLDLCLDLADRLRDLSDVVVVLIGGGTSAGRLRQATRDRRLANVRFLPYQPRPELRYSLGTADLFIVPLAPAVHGFMVATKVFSAMASGRPFVAPVQPQSDVAALVARFGCGVRVDPGDLAMFEKVVRELRANPGEAQAMGRRGRHALERHFARTVVTPRYEAMLRSVLAAAGRVGR